MRDIDLYKAISYSYFEAFDEQWKPGFGTFLAEVDLVGAYVHGWLII